MYSMRRAPLVLRPLAQTAHAPRRPHSTSPPPPNTRTRRPFRTALLITSALSGGAVLGLYYDAKSCPEPPFKLAEAASEHGASPSLLALSRAYLVYGLISYETLVNNAPVILDTLLRLPLIGTVVESVVRRTFFDHFVGGETAREAFPLLSVLRKQNKGALLAYSAEVNEREAAGASRASHAGASTGKPAHEPAHKCIVAEIIRGLDVAADFEDEFGTRAVSGRRTWVAIKPSALLPNAEALRNLSLYLTRTRRVLTPPVPFPGTPASSDLTVLNTRIPHQSPLTAKDVEDLNGLYADLIRICAHAKDRRVRILIDAEHSWYQPAIDAFGHALMERFNKLPDRTIASGLGLGSSIAEGTDLQPLVYVTYQAYLRRNPIHLAHSLALARQNNYALGVKLVRGAYHPYELAAHEAASASPSGSVAISPDPHPPVHLSKPDTDACYNECASFLVRAIADDMKSSTGRAPRIGVLFATHNWTTTELILGELVGNGLAHESVPQAGAKGKGTVTISPEVAERLTFSQLYRMSDSLTEYLVRRVKSTTPFVIKYVPYGALAEVMPYMSRRAIENNSVLGNGGAVRERKEAAKQIWRKVFGGAGL